MPVGTGLNTSLYPMASASVVSPGENVRNEKNAVAADESSRLKWWRAAVDLKAGRLTMHRLLGGRHMEYIFWFLLLIGVFTSLWELEQIRQILSKRPRSDQELEGPPPAGPTRR